MAFYAAGDGGGTVYTAAMRKAMETFAPSGDPGLVLFFTDGEDNEPDETKRLITKLSSKPVFWQFVGITGKDRPDFGFLNDLDTLGGRVIDNAGFFEVGVHDITDEELYEKLIHEFKDYPARVTNSGGKVRW